jgi:hypothetical protein
VQLLPAKNELFKFTQSICLSEYYYSLTLYMHLCVCVGDLVARFLLTCLLGHELPVVPLGPLGECLPRVVLHPSILPPYRFPSREEQSALYDFCNFSRKPLTVFTFFTWLGISFQFSVTLLEKKFFLISSLASFGLTFNGFLVYTVHKYKNDLSYTLYRFSFVYRRWILRGSVGTC